MAMEPRAFGKYQLVEEIGIGAMARVYRAVRSGPMGFHKEVAIKQLTPDAEGDRAVRALVNEARLGGFLHHRNIVEIYEFDRVDETYYIAMEFVRGFTLDQVIKRAAPDRPIPPRVVAQIAMQICAGLSYAHDAVDKDGRPMNLVHRDLKPANVMLTHDGVVKIMDFGIARATTNLYLTQASGTTKGTPAYMSPEQTMAETSDQLDRRSDLFSLGSLLAEMITGRRCFASENLYDILRRIARADAGEVIDEVRARIPAMEPILRRAFARDREERYQTAGEMARDIRAIYDDLPGDERLGSWIGRWMERGDGEDAAAGGIERFAPMRIEPPSVELDPPSLDRVTATPHRVPWWIAAVAGGALALALGVLVLALAVVRSGREPVEVPPAGAAGAEAGVAGSSPADGSDDGAAGSSPVDGGADGAAGAATAAEPSAGGGATTSAEGAEGTGADTAARDEAPALIVTSSPPGAAVSLDGRRLGHTPFRYEGGVPGRRYTLTCSLDGHEDAAVAGVFPGRGVVTLHASLARAAAEPPDGDADAAEPPAGGTDAAAGRPDVSAAVSPATVDAIVGSNAAVRRCLTQAAERGDPLPERVWIRFTVHDDGHVSGTHALSEELSGSETERCLAQQVNGLRFGPFTGAASRTVKFYLDAP